MVTRSVVSRPFPRGWTAEGEEVFILTWRDLEFFSRCMSRESGIARTAQSMAVIINAPSQLKPPLASVIALVVRPGCLWPILIRRWLLACNDEDSALLFLDRSVPVRRCLLVRKKLSLHNWQIEERQLLSTLQAQGALRLDRDGAWNAQAYLEARHIPIEVAISTGVGYLEHGASALYGQQVQRSEDHLIFP